MASPDTEICVDREEIINFDKVNASVVIVGGSLAGLTFALACADRGIRTQMLERGHELHQRGGALGVDRFLLRRALGMDSRSERDAGPFPILTEHRQAASWWTLNIWLRDLALRRPEITLRNNCSVVAVVQTDNIARVITASGEQIDAQVIVGADGYQSTIRKAVDPEQPHALYAGYLLWRSLVPEANLPLNTDWPRNTGGIVLSTKSGYRLVAYPVAGFDGSLEPGKRLLSFAWYDKGRDCLLEKMRCLSPARQVLSSLSPGNIPRQVRVELRDIAPRIWPEPWSTAIVYAIEQGSLFGTPVAEHLPQRLVQGRLAIIGDAAHVASPVAGQGFVAGILDAIALADALKDALDRPESDILSILQIYEDKRLADAREMVASSRRWSNAYMRGKQIATPPAWKPARTDARSLLFRTRKK